MNMKNNPFLIVLVLCIISYANVYAQNLDEARLETMTNEFIQRAESSDALSLMTNIKSYYSSLSVANKKKMLSFYVSKVSYLLESEKKDKALAVIYLYQNLADRNDEKLPTLLFIKGNLYSERMDSIHLKETITELSVETIKGKPNVSDYVLTLNGRLDKIRTYISPYKKINGLWVADEVFWDKGKKNRIGLLPQTTLDLVLQIDYDAHEDTVSVLAKPSMIPSEINNDIQVTVLSKIPDWSSAQIAIPYASDSLYVLWSSEKIDKKNQIIASILRGAVSANSAAIHADLAQKNIYNTSSRMFGGIATTFMEVGLNAMISTIFTPSKAMFILEGRFKLENEFLMTGALTYKYKRIAANGSEYENKILKADISMIRWLPESNVVFGRPNWQQDKGQWFNDSSHSKHKCPWGAMVLLPENRIGYSRYNIFNSSNTRFEYCEEKIGAKLNIFSGNSSKEVKALKAYNIDQYKWLMLYNDSLLRSQGYKGKFIIGDNVQPDLGIRYRTLDEKIKKKTKVTQGVYIYDVDEMSAAYVGGVKKGDIILSVNGQNVKEYEDMDGVTNNIQIGDWLAFKVLRKKKNLDLTVRVTWK